MKSILSLVIAILFASTSFIGSVSAQSAETFATIKVKGIGCQMDVKRIQTNVTELEGVSECKAGKLGAKTSFVVKYDAELLTLDQLYAAIEGTAGCANPDDRPYKVKP